jgi:RNA polymerase sigma-70 factor (ECF subfamily)
LHQAEVQHDKEEKLVALEQAILQLNQKQRLCVELFYLKLMSYEDISAKTGYSINEVKSYLQNGKRNLKQVLAQQGISLGLILFLWIQQHA